MKRVSLTNVLVGVAFGVVALSIGCPAKAATFPFYNADGYSTVIVRVNPTDADIALPSDLVGCGQYCVVPKVKAHSVSRMPFGRSGTGVATIPVQEGLVVGVEITTPCGAAIDVPELFALDTATVYDLERAGPFNGGLFIAAERDTVATVIGGQVVNLKAGEGAIVPDSSTTVPNSGTQVVTQLGAGRIYVFGFVNHQTTGSLQYRKAY